ncbi:ferritin-like domain-containing protein [Halobaculum sp. CBA1158]|uniref:ferritin-like domain-containing protein n=1 Tax=Halobaculum sp. CBA1158 TaxID=2904243 RepID=UPI001F3AE6AA|nr:ferritin-like domain-containing protein [Halobaculum sp. CBA1158]UIP00801.1 ferritin-like domain-containing protein [Halobaculum sp. CBA1158]
MTDSRRGSNATDDTTSDRLSRRRFTGALAAAGAVGLAGCSGTDGEATTGEPTDEMDTPMDTPTETEAGTETDEPTEEPAPNPDVDVLNYALTLEHLENAFYREGLAEFSDDEIMMADSLSEFGETLRMQVPEYLALAGEHEAAHVDAISATIEDLGGTPVGEADYDFGYSTPSEFLATAGALENTGVAAYTGAAGAIKANAVLGAAAGIQSVEARHASFLNVINGEMPYPAGVEEAASVEEVFEIAGQFITSEVSSPAPLDGEDEPTAERKADDDTSDVDVLNYALTLEHLENAFYREGLAEFSDDELMNASALSEYGETLRMTVPDRLRTAGAHEAAHVDAIADTVEQLGGTPVEEAEYDFGYTNPSEFLGVARALENTGVSAYAGQAGTVSADAVFDAAVGIHAVEARHASFLNELNVESPFPMAVDEPRTMEEVTEIAGQFIVEE